MNFWGDSETPISKQGSQLHDKKKYLFIFLTLSFFLAVFEAEVFTVFASIRQKLFSRAKRT